jgi:hypothetical protein
MERDRYIWFSLGCVLEGAFRVGAFGELVLWRCWVCLFATILNDSIFHSTIRAFCSTIFFHLI